MNTKHNGIISFWKFTFSMLILALHLGKKHMDVQYNFEAGSIAVDFFFIVSGYLFCKKCINQDKIKNIGKSTKNFFLKKVFRFLPYIIFLWIISLPFTILVCKYRIVDYIGAFYNLLYLPIKDFPLYEIYGTTWYIVVMIAIESILYPILTKYKKSFIYVISPIIVFFGTGYILIKFGSFAIPWTSNILAYGGFIRGLVTINIGMILYLIIESFKKINLTDLSKFLVTIFEIVGYVSIFYICNLFMAHVRYDCLMIIILSLCICISFSEKSLFNTFSNNKLFYYLEKLSLPIYINQWLLIYILEYIIKKYSISISYYKELLILIIFSVVVAIITEFFVKLYEKNKKNIKDIFVME